MTTHAAIRRTLATVLSAALLLVAGGAQAQTLPSLWGSPLYRVELSITGTNVTGTFTSLDDPEAPPGRIAGQVQAGGQAFLADWTYPAGPDTGGFKTWLRFSSRDSLLTGYRWSEETEPAAFALHRAVNGQVPTLVEPDDTDGQPPTTPATGSVPPANPVAPAHPVTPATPVPAVRPAATVVMCQRVDEQKRPLDPGTVLAGPGGAAGAPGQPGSPGATPDFVLAVSTLANIPVGSAIECVWQRDGKEFSRNRSLYAAGGRGYVWKWGPQQGGLPAGNYEVVVLCAGQERARQPFQIVAGPRGPDGPAAPVTPTNPITRTTPVTPANPITRTAPVTPTNPITPTTPVTPAAPPVTAVFPQEPFNGMQITYRVTGATLGQPTDSSGFTTTRSLQGKITGDTLTVSGTVRMGMGYGADVTVSVWSGGQKDEKKFYVKNEGDSGNPTNFRVAVPVAQNAGTGGFTIRMDGRYSMGGGNRGLIVTGQFTQGATGATATAPVTPAAPVPVIQPVATLVMCRRVDANQQLVGAGASVFTAPAPTVGPGDDSVVAVITYSGMAVGTSWECIWKRDGVLLLRHAHAIAGPDDRGTSLRWDPRKLEMKPGNHEVSINYAGRELARQQFRVVAAPSSSTAPAAPPAPPPSPAATFPSNTTWNGLQIGYGVVGATLGAPAESGGVIPTLSFQGKTTGDTLTVAGTVKGCGGDGADVTVLVWSGVHRAEKKFFVKNEGFSAPATAYSVSVPVKPGDGPGGFSIRVDGRFSPGISGIRGLMVTGQLQPR